MVDQFEDLVLLLEPGQRPEPVLLGRLRAAEEQRNAEVQRVLGEMEKGNYEIVDIDNDEY